MPFIQNGVVITNFNFSIGQLLKSYFPRNYQIIGAACKLEVLQANIKLPGLFRAINYPSIDYDMETTAEIISKLVEFEQQYNVNSRHAIHLTIKVDDNTCVDMNFYNTGMKRQEDLITPHLTVNPVLLIDKNSVFDFQLTTNPQSVFTANDTFNVLGILMCSVTIKELG